MSFQITAAILRDGGSVVQRIYDEHFEEKDDLNLGEAFITSSGNLLCDALVHVKGSTIDLHNIFWCDTHLCKCVPFFVHSSVLRKHIV